MPGGHDQTLQPFIWRAAKLYPDTEIVSRTGEGMTRYTYGEYDDRRAQLANALQEAGIEKGDRVATFCWNHHRHFETYFGVPTMGAQLHTINPMLPKNHIRHIVSDADDQLIFVDPETIEELQDARAGADDEFDSVGQYVVMGDEVPETDLEPVVDYETFIEGQATEYDWPELDQERPAGMCYTSGTTGKPKGVEYTHQMLWSHTMQVQQPAGLPVDDDDVVMPVVPMFHVNAWGMPFTTTSAGAKHVYPGPSPDPADIARLIEEEEVTVTAGVPTVWLGLQEYMQDHDVDLSSLDRIVIGGSAAPEAMIRWFDEQGVEVLHAWGMTEMSPIGSISHVKSTLEDASEEKKMEKRRKQGLMVPGLEFKVINDEGERIEWDGEEFGELHIRGPSVTKEYFKRPEANEEDFEDGWLKTGDVVTIDPDGYMKIVDRAKDVIKSGGEWISSVELENTIMAHEEVAEATVIGVPHERWQERPVAFVVPTADTDVDALKESVLDLVREEYPKWWVPDDVVTIEEVPKTATGKFDKKTLRDEYADQDIFEGSVPEEAAPEDAK